MLGRNIIFFCTPADVTINRTTFPKVFAAPVKVLSGVRKPLSVAGKTLRCVQLLGIFLALEHALASGASD